MSASPEDLDRWFQAAIAAMDAGDVHAIERELERHPALVTARLDAPGPWLTAQVPGALKGFFARPYLLWFVAEDPERTGRLPANIVEILRVLLAAMERTDRAWRQQPLDVALRLVCWSGVAARQGVQLPMIDLLLDAGARPAEEAHNALVNGHVAAAAHLIARGGRLTLATAACLDRTDDLPALDAAATPAQRQFALVLAALNGRTAGVRWLIGAGVPVNEASPDLYPHGTPLHHAVASGSLPTVQALVEGGADVTRADTAWHGTPRGWALYYVDSVPPDRRAAFAEIAAYLAAREGAHVRA